ncbi:hypothetical protein IF2G_07519 [Cordyceps javanica]|nr:hypothetical protein IF2G_07519 [Cordyceps javanica]
MSLSKDRFGRAVVTLAVEWIASAIITFPGFPLSLFEASVDPMCRIADAQGLQNKLSRSQSPRTRGWRVERAMTMESYQ